MAHTCPHGNRSCTRTNLCTPCSGAEVVRDGKFVRVPLMLMDSMQREIAAHLAASASDASTTGDNGYAASVAALDYRTRESNRQPSGEVEVVRDAASDGQTCLDSYYSRVITENAESSARRAAAADAESARVQAYADHHREKAAQRSHDVAADPRSAAYDAMCRELDWRTKSKATGSR